MNRVVGFALFFIGVGIVIGLLAPKCLVMALIAACCLLAGYHLFCC
ncbi:hypothetical protein [Blautia hydrogenotrophica]|uniref:Uncharacterized protein n=1 Tax=Blautia hydrogenotrophica (strain DSM 10507 / JCM 14656 / S5a33) TaxID=476272 RepID=C0CI37_BLAHS|nr:hypothetical protein [Blautia hydrogenotrophica]EEG50625.1 hypothetical protein RUMHYD_00501 [Blautia hydrogenotrophica DSM 10507]MCT6796518.1 hypothetical protein [Blautia hydrogenotrophica]MEE0461189.1 hypothetical protein [Blautia hydrogenotrophica]SCI16604.1 Uncharacterised protein [uncultured Blautia sp.]